MGPSPLSPSPCLRKRLLSGTSQGVLQKDAKARIALLLFQLVATVDFISVISLVVHAKLIKPMNWSFQQKSNIFSDRGMFLWSPHQHTNTTGFAVLCGDSQEMYELLVLLCKSPNELELKGKVTRGGKAKGNNYKHIRPMCGT